MKFALSSLKEYLETSASLEEICQTLTNIGLEVESVEDKAKILAPFSVAKILEAKPHENSNKLKICLVETATHEARSTKHEQRHHCKSSVALQMPEVV